jgi:hypothetical protein
MAPALALYTVLTLTFGLIVQVSASPYGQRPRNPGKINAVHRWFRWRCALNYFLRIASSHLVGEQYSTKP